MSITELAEVRGRIALDISDANLQKLIDRVESRIVKAVGHPSDERADRFVALGVNTYNSPADPIYVDNFGPYRALPGYTNMIALAHDPAEIGGVQTAQTDAASADELDPASYYLSGPYLYRANGVTWERETIVTWTPVDFTDDFIEATIDLVRLRMARTAYTSTKIGNEWAATSPADWDAAERAVIERLAPAVVFA